MKKLTNLTKQEVLDYIEEHGLGIFLSYTEVYDKDGNPVEGTFDNDDDYIEPEAGTFDTLYEYWGVGTNTGFSTFDVPMDEDKAKYAGVLFHLLVNEYGMGFGDAECIACAYVKTYKVMQKPITEEEMNAAQQAMVEAIDAGRVKIAGMPGSYYVDDEEDFISDSEDICDEDDDNQ